MDIYLRMKGICSLLSGIDMTASIYFLYPNSKTRLAMNVWLIIMKILSISSSVHY